MPKLTDSELIAAIESEEAISLGEKSSELQKERATALDRYRGAPMGNEIEGRSQIVDKSVLDTIEWIMPSLIRIYLGGDDIGKFEPRGPQDEAAAEVETDVCNWYLEAKNDLFSQINATLRDALLLKNGYIVGYWQSRYDTMVETYKGLSDEEAAMLMQDDEVEIVEHSEYPDPSPPMMDYAAPPVPLPGVAPSQAPMSMMGAPGVSPQPSQPPMLHDVRVEKKTCEEYVAVESIPPDEMIVSRNHRWTSLLDADFVQWRRRVSIGQLRSEGFDIPDDVATGVNDISQEAIERQRFQETSLEEDSTPDPARRVVTFKDTYIRIDLRNTGKPQLWRVCIIHGYATVILKEQADIIPFAAFSPIIYPHSHIGVSVYDLIDDIGVVKTMLMRQLIDGLFLQHSGRVAIDVSKVTLEDLLVSRPGQIVRVEGDPQAAIFPIVTPDAGQTILGALEYMATVNEQRTGVTTQGFSAGLDANTLNKTATGVQAMQSAANQRIELIARTLASGFKDLFLIVHALALKHSTKPLQIKLKGNWTPVNPREWTKRTDFSISVGLGTGTPEAQLGKLQALSQVMQIAMGMGLAGPEEMFNFISEIFKSAGYKFADKFIHEPPKGPDGKPIPPPQQPNPIVQAEQIKAQASMQSAQMKVQSDAQIAQVKSQSDAQLAQVKAQADAQTEQARAQADMQVQQNKIATNAELDLAKAKMQLELDNIRHDREQQTQIQIAHIKAASAIEVARITKAYDDGQEAEAKESAGESAGE